MGAKIHPGCYWTGECPYTGPCSCCPELDDDSEMLLRWPVDADGAHSRAECPYPNRACADCSGLVDDCEYAKPRRHNDGAHSYTEGASAKPTWRMTVPFVPQADPDRYKGYQAVPMTWEPTWRMALLLAGLAAVAGYLAGRKA